MRHLLLVLFAFFAATIASCSSNTLPGQGDGPRALDLAGCSPNCPDLAAAPSTDLAGSANRLCASVCNHCTSGACCAGAPNNGCCNSGEWCDNGTCRCGNGGTCPAGEFCASGGPAPVDPNACGFICCGGPGHPCPL